MCFVYYINIKGHGSPMVCSPSVQVKMNRMRLRIAQRLKEAQNTCAMLTTFNEVDMRWAPAAPEKPMSHCDHHVIHVDSRDWFSNVSSLCFSNIQEMRTAYKDAFLKKHNIKLGFMSAFVKAAAYALTDQPAVNGGTVTQTYFHC